MQYLGKQHFPVSMPLVQTPEGIVCAKVKICWVKLWKTNIRESGSRVSCDCWHGQAWVAVWASERWRSLLPPLWRIMGWKVERLSARKAHAHAHTPQHVRSGVTHDQEVSPSRPPLTTEWISFLIWGGPWQDMQLTRELFQVCVNRQYNSIL